MRHRLKLAAKKCFLTTLGNQHRNPTALARHYDVSLDQKRVGIVTCCGIRQSIRVASSGFELRLGTDRETGDAVLRAGWHKSPPSPAPPLPDYPLDAPRPRWTDAEVRGLLARLPSRERRRVRWAAIHSGSAGTEWQRRLLAGAKFLLALPVGVYLVLVWLGFGSMNFHPITLAVSIGVWFLPFSSVFLFFALLLVIVREWAVRTAGVPLGDEFEVLLNRVYPLRGQISAAPASAPGVAGDGLDTARLAESARL